MDGVLILAHGSKRTETEKILNSLTNKVKDITGESLIYQAYLQFSQQNLEVGVDYLVDRGATKIKVIPMFLFDGAHVAEDIPNELNEIRKKHPGIEVKLSRHLGDDDRIADIIADRIRSLD